MVKEARFYPLWSEVNSSKDNGKTALQTGILAAKKIINRLHGELAVNGYDQVEFRLPLFTFFLILLKDAHGYPDYLLSANIRISHYLLNG